MQAAGRRRRGHSRARKRSWRTGRWGRRSAREGTGAAGARHGNPTTTTCLSLVPCALLARTQGSLHTQAAAQTAGPHKLSRDEQPRVMQGRPHKAQAALFFFARPVLLLPPRNSHSLAVGVVHCRARRPPAGQDGCGSHRCLPRPAGGLPPRPARCRGDRCCSRRLLCVISTLRGRTGVVAPAQSAQTDARAQDISDPPKKPQMHSAARPPPRARPPARCRRRAQREARGAGAGPRPDRAGRRQGAAAAAAAAQNAPSRGGGKTSDATRTPGQTLRPSVPHRQQRQRQRQQQMMKPTQRSSPLGRVRTRLRFACVRSRRPRGAHLTPPRNRSPCSSLLTPRLHHATQTTCLQRTLRALPLPLARDGHHAQKQSDDRQQRQTDATSLALRLGTSPGHGWGVMGVYTWRS